MHATVNKTMHLRPNRRVNGSTISLLALLCSVTELNAQGVTPIPDITVVAPSDRTPARSQRSGQRVAPTSSKPAEGSEAAGYKPDTVTNFGPFGKKPILDVPYSVNVISSALIENKIASTSDDVFKLSPVVQTYFPTGASHGSGLGYNIRGFQQTAIAEDGLRTNSFYPMALEDKERVEIYSGLVGFLYGPQSVGGFVNYVYKRPVLNPIANVKVGTYGNLQGFVHGDFGGPIDKEGRFAYRLNIVEQGGKTSIDSQSLDRQLVSAALDWHITPDTTLGVLGTFENYDMHNFSTYWNYIAINGASPFNYKWIPSPSRNYSPIYSSLPYTIARTEVNLNSKLSDIFTARLAYSFTNVYFGSYFGNLNYLTTGSNFGTYNQNIWKNTGTRYTTHSAYGFIDAHFMTGEFEHKVTTGYYGNAINTEYGAGTASPLTSTSGLNLFYGPAYRYLYLAPNVFNSAWYYGARYVGNVAAQNNFIVGDDVKFTNFLSALLGLNVTEIIAQNYNSTPPFAMSSAYNKRRVTPTISLILKPTPWFTTYATYSESLEQGQVVPSTAAYTNAGAILPPFRSREYEIGAKAEVGGLLVTAALFNINKVNQYAQSNPNGKLTFVQDGRQVNKGIELTITGNVMEGWRLIGGATFMDARVVRTASQSTDNKYPMNVANQIVKFTSEYDVPLLPGLTLTGGVYYIGKQAADPINSVWLSPYVTEDLGLRYRTNLPTGQEFIFRLNASNIANTAYWASTYATGAPRNIAMSAEFKF